MDTTIVNLISILVSGTGIFCAFTAYSAPELAMSYSGVNPYKIKADLISSTYTILFALLAVLGLVLQAIKEIAWYDLPSRSYSTATYTQLFFFGIVAMAILTTILILSGRVIAKIRWIPKVADVLSDAYDSAVFVYSNDGWRKEQIDRRDSFDDPEEIKRINYIKIGESIQSMCKVFGIKTKNLDDSIALKRLSSYFKSRQNKGLQETASTPASHEP